MEEVGCKISSGEGEVKVKKFRSFTTLRRDHEVSLSAKITFLSFFFGHNVLFGIKNR